MKWILLLALSIAGELLGFCVPRPSVAQERPGASPIKAFELPPIDAERVTAAGIRKLSGKHLDVYTDLPLGHVVDELPQVFAAAVPAWSEYFGVVASKLSNWKIVTSVMADQEKFVRAGLYPGSLPDFQHGYNVGSQIWIYDQPSDYFRRHLLLHEGTHAFMLRWLGGGGPPWYMEGMAELVATHRWENGQLQLAVMPRTKEEVPYWGRVKIVKDEYAAGRGMSLIEIMRYDGKSHLKVEAYGWCWAAAAFLSAHPLSQRAFRNLQADVSDATLTFSKRFYERVKDDWPAIQEDWQIFVHDCDYGYDFARACVERKPAVSLTPSGTVVSVSTDRGWQSSGVLVEAGKSYQLHASGRFQVAGGERSWPCEAGGVTLRYFRGKPLGMLLAAVGDQAGSEAGKPALMEAIAIGVSTVLKPQVSGTLYFKINEPSSGLSDNSGVLTVGISDKK